MTTITYFLFRILVFLFWLMPFWMVYRLCDLLAFLLQHVFKYRYKVVTTNLKHSFPEKSDNEIASIRSDFYKHLGDIFLEGIKSFKIPPKKMKDRYLFLNCDLVDQFTKKGQSLVIVTAHYGNWEWSVKTIGLQTFARSIGFYKPLKNKLINDYLFKKRPAENVFVESMADTRMTFDKYSDKPSHFVFITDQSPSNIEKAQWLTFLNQDTACLHGADRNARKLGFPVVFADIQRTKRGYYEVTFSLLSENAATTSDGEITKLYFEKLEEIICAKPAHWLWSHKRWKHSRPVGV